MKTDKDGTAKGSVKSDRPTDGKVAASTAKVSKGQTLQQIVKKQLGNTDNLFQIAALNKSLFLLSWGLVKSSSLNERVITNGYR